MAFMEHEITGKQLWYAIDGNCGTDYIPADVVNSPITMFVGVQMNNDHPAFQQFCELLADYTQHTEIDSVTAIEGYGARLSAPGYLDCTEWCVFDTAAEAEAYLEEYYPEDEEDEE